MKECQGQLLHRVRNGLASAQEQTAFEAHLGSCDTCRMTIDIMDDLDAIGEPEPGDWQRVAKIANAGVSAFGRGVTSPRRFARRPWQLALAALVLTGAAAAGVAVTRMAQDSPQQGNLPASQGPAVTPATPTPPSKEQSPPPPVDAEAPSEESEIATAVPTKKTAPSSKSSRTATETYRAANDARRAGKTAEAIEGYRRLQNQFPASPEAHASRVSLGGLLLRSGSSRAALAQFDAYLASSGGQLTAEALFGRAQSLRALGRSAEEAQNLDRLVSTYPNSAYATHAQRRLAELR